MTRKFSVNNAVTTNVLVISTF